MEESVEQVDEDEHKTGMAWMTREAAQAMHGTCVTTYVCTSKCEAGASATAEAYEVKPAITRL